MATEDPFSPEKVVEMKHAFAGIAELLWSYHRELRSQGFNRRDAMELVIAYQRAIVLGSTGGSDG